MRNRVYVKFFNSIFDHLRVKAAESDELIALFGIFGAINFPLFYFVGCYFFHEDYYDGLGMRLIATIACLFLIFVKQWPPHFHTFKHWVWYGTLTYAAPFFVTFEFLKSGGSQEGILNIVLVLFFLICALDWLSFSVVTFTGATLAALLFRLTSGPFNLYSKDLFMTFIHGAFVIITALVFLRRREIFAEEKLKTMKLLGSSIAHEMRTPFMAIATGAEALKATLPIYMKAYHLAKDALLLEETVPRIKNERIAQVPETIIAVSQRAQFLINMVLMKVTSNPAFYGQEICDMHDIIQTVLKEYPFAPHQRDLIVLEEPLRFKFKGNKELFKHVLYNLLKNAIYAIEAAGKGSITFSTERLNQTYALVIKDTGKGISKAILPHIFDQFFSRTDHGSGVGLAFCKKVMKSFSGDIGCESLENEFSKFILTFPYIEQNRIR